MELLLRLAEEKFMKKNDKCLYNEAMKLLYDNHLKKEIEKYDSNKFHTEKLWNIFCDNVVSKNYTTIL